VAPAVPEEREQAKEMLSWPIGAGKLFVWLVEVNAPITIILIVIALLSINLWVLNLLPFPALDGGRIVTTTLYSVFSFFPRSQARFLQFEKLLHAAWFILLLILMIYVAWLDIGRFF
jgi:regulator of sigma E protease